MPILALDAGTKLSDLCHQDDQGRLTHVSGFTSHVRTGDNGNTVFSVVQISIIGNEHIVFDHLFHYRMTAVL